MTIPSEEARRVLADSELLYDEAEVDAALDRIARAISADLAETLPVVLCVMTGGLIPTGKLLTRLAFPLELDYLHVTRYRGETAGGDLTWLARPQTPLRDRTVLVVDDILDEGITLASILGQCREEGARNVYTAVLVDKRHDRRHPGASADYIGLEVEDRYVFGAGMDYKGLLRNMGGIYAAPDA